MMDFGEGFEGRLWAARRRVKGPARAMSFASLGSAAESAATGCGGVVGELAGAGGVHGGSLVQLSVVRLVSCSVGVCRCQFWCWG